MIVVLALLSLIPVFILGDFVRARLAPGRQYDPTIRFGLAFGLGSGGVALIFFYASLFDFQRALLKKLLS